MAMQSSGSGSVSPDINVTPLIDVLLVLLIIFMVIMPQLPRGLDGAIPQGTASSQATAPLRLEIAGDDAGAPLRYKLDQQEVPLEGLGVALQHAVARRQDKTLFLRASRSLSYQQVAAVMGISHEAGAAAIVLEPERGLQGLHRRCRSRWGDPPPPLQPIYRKTWRLRRDISIYRQRNGLGLSIGNERSRLHRGKQILRCAQDDNE